MGMGGRGKPNLVSQYNSAEWCDAEAVWGLREQVLDGMLSLCTSARDVNMHQGLVQSTSG
jgi:hypothetical protein